MCDGYLGKTQNTVTPNSPVPSSSPKVFIAEHIIWCGASLWSVGIRYPLPNSRAAPGIFFFYHFKFTIIMMCAKYKNHILLNALDTK